MKTQTIELTSKKYKLLSRLGGWTLLASVVIVVQTESGWAALAMILSLCAFLWGRIGKWYNHE